MVKKRTRDAETLPDAPRKGIHAEDSDSDSDNDVDMINVEFEWFNMKPEIDFHGLKSLTRQLFDVDSQIIDLSALADLILSQPTIGSTVKVDGDETDPYAFITVLNMREHKDKPVMRAIQVYLETKARSNPSLAKLAEVLANPSCQVGLVLAERLINVPTEIAPPMFSMLIDEVEAAVEDKEPYNFTHYLVLSRTYREVESALDQEDAPKQKKKKATEAETFYFHPEDEALHRYAVAFGGWDFTHDGGKEAADSKRAFQEMGIIPQGHATLIEVSNFPAAVKAVADYIGSPQ